MSLTSAQLDAVSCIADSASRVTIPFDFDLDTHESTPSDSRRTARLRELAWLSAWADTWKKIGSTLCQPLSDENIERPGYNRGAFLVTDFPASPGPFDIVPCTPAALDRIQLVETAASSSNPLSLWFLESDESGFVRMPRSKITAGTAPPNSGPDIGFAFALSAGTREVPRGPEVFCVGVPSANLSASDWRERVEFEMAFETYIASQGSVKTSGNGWLAFVTTSLLIPFALQSFGKEVADPMKEYFRRIEIRSEYQTTVGPCVVEGYLNLDINQLTAAFEQGVVSGTRRGVCFEQAALKLAGRSPGTIDGYAGPNTDAARTAFKYQWGIPGAKCNSPEYVSALRRALQGKEPPSPSRS